MIKKFETFVEEWCRIGDYVICEMTLGDQGYTDILLQKFLKNTVGQIISIKDHNFNYCVKFDIIHKKLKKYAGEIMVWYENKYERTR